MVVSRRLLSLRRVLGGRRQRLAVGVACVLMAGILYVCYQALSISRLGEELTAQHVAGRSEGGGGGGAKIIHYQKADFPVQLLRGAEEEKGEGLKEEGGGGSNLGAVQQSLFRDHGIRIRGVLNEDVKHYIPNSRGNFRCRWSGEEVAYHRVNDNYCDCADGSDEPSTDACHNGRYYCTHQEEEGAEQGRGGRNQQKAFVVSSRVNDGICDCCDGSDEWADIRVPEHAAIEERYEKSLGIDQTPCHFRCVTHAVSRRELGL